MKFKFANLRMKEIVIEICAFFLIILFVYVATSKLLDMKGFRGSIANQPFDNKYTTALIILLPTFEYLTVALLLFRRTKLAGFFVSLLMMIVFTIYIGMILSEKVYDRIPCSCGGIMKELSWTQHLFINIFFTVLSALGIYLMRQNRKNLKDEPISSRSALA